MFAWRAAAVLFVCAAASGAWASAVVGVVVAPPESPATRPGARAGFRPPVGPTRGSRAPVVPLVVAPLATSVETYLDGILGRSLFDPARTGTVGPLAATPALVLLGTVVAEPAALSSALIADDAVPGLPGSYSTGHKVRDRVVVAIRNEAVELRRPDGTIEVLSLSAAEQATVVPEPASPVRTVSEGRYDGRPDGVRLAALRKGTLPDALGLKNGDVIRSMNDLPLTSPGDALTALSSLQEAAVVCVDLTRRGEPTRLCYEIE